jgi:hypothetical protein
MANLFKGRNQIVFQHELTRARGIRTGEHNSYFIKNAENEFIRYYSTMEIAQTLCLRTQMAS